MITAMLQFDWLRARFLLLKLQSEPPSFAFDFMWCYGTMAGQINRKAVADRRRVKVRASKRYLFKCFARRGMFLCATTRLGVA